MQKSFFVCALSLVASAASHASETCPIVNVDEFTHAVMKAQLNQSEEKRLFSYAGKQWFMDPDDWEKLAQTKVNKKLITTLTAITFLRQEVLAKPDRVRCYYSATLESLYSANISSSENQSQNEQLKAEFKMTYLLNATAKK